MKQEFFRFKQCVILQDPEVFKVNTDAVLLAAWTSIKKANAILEIGSGTGVISILLAQKNPSAQITTIELQPRAAALTNKNIKLNLPLTKNIKTIHDDIRCFNSPMLFDLIITNPPYYEKDTKSASKKDRAAKHDETLDQTSLLNSIKNVTHTKSSLFVVYPLIEGEKFIERAAQIGWYPVQILYVKPAYNKPIHRILIKLEQVKKKIKSNNLTILKKNQEFTSNYKNLTKEFYLKF